MTFPIPYTWTISGRITYLDGTLFTTGIIKAFHVCNGTWYYLGESGVNGDGTYQITYSSASFQNEDSSIEHPDVKIQVFDYQGNVVWESRNTMAFESQQTFSIIIDEEQQDAPPQEVWIVRGTVAYDSGLPLVTGAVKAYDYNDGINCYLNSAILKSDGSFELSYTKASFQRDDLNRETPNLVLYVYDLKGKLLQSFSLDNPSATEENVSIIIPLAIPETDDNYVVYGRVVNNSGRPLKDVYVQAFCLDFARNAFQYHRLNSEFAITDDNGNYEIVYSPLSLPRRIEEPSPDNPKDQVCLFAKFFLNPDGNLELPEIWSSKWNCSNLVLGASRRQEINFTIDSVSISRFSKFAELENALSVYLSAVMNEFIRDGEDNQVSQKEDKIHLFVDYSFRNVLPGFRESVNQEDVVAYFRAYEIVYRAEKLLSDSFDSEDLLLYASGCFALCQKGYDNIPKLQAANRQDVQNHLLEAVALSLVSSETDIPKFVEFWERLQGVSTASERESADLNARDLLNLWEKSEIQPGAETDTDSKVDILLKQFYDSEADIDSFLEDVKNPDLNVSLTTDEYSRLKLVFDLKKFFENFSDGIREAYKTIVRVAKQLSGSNVPDEESTEPSLKILLCLTEEQWEGLVEDISSSYKERSDEKKLALPVSFSGTTAEEQKSLYKIKLQKLIISWFPQDALLLRLSRIERPEDSDLLDTFDYIGWKAIGQILLLDESWKFFSLDKDVLDDFVESHSINIEESLENYRDNLSEEEQTEFTLTGAILKDYIKTLQRLYRLTTDYDSIVYLLNQGIKSAYQIAQTSEDEFVAAHHAGLDTMKNAKQIYCLAAQYTSEVSLQMAKYYGSLTEQGETVPSVSRGMSKTRSGSSDRNGQGNVAPSRIEQPVIANWKNLFGALNRNAALKGQSVLSPSAYLMDLLDFLKGEGYRILKTRRPDIWNLLLSKENAETALPTIDIVVELLECLVVPKSLGELDYNTDHRSEAELRAEPAFAGNLDSAYAKLVDSVYPMDLPRNFHAEKMTALLKNVSLSVSDLILAQKNPDDEYHYTTLRLSPSLIDALRLPEYDDATGGESSLRPVYELWGLNYDENTVLCPDKATVVTGLWSDVLSNASVFLYRCGLSMTDLQEILLYPTFEKEGVRITATTNAYQLGDISAFCIENISESFARKVSRFVRLKRLLGWNNEDILLVFNLDLKDIDRVAHLKTLTSASVSEILAWVCDKDELFSCVYPDVFIEDEIENEENQSEGTENEEDVKCRLLEKASVSLGVSQADLLYALELDNESFSNNFRKNLKILYRISTFAKRLGVSVQKFELLSFLLGNPSAREWNLENRIECFLKIKDILNSPLDVDSLIYLALPISPAIKNKAKQFVHALKGSLLEICDTVWAEKQEEIEREFPEIRASVESRNAFYEWVKQNVSDFADSWNGIPVADMITGLCEKEIAESDNLNVAVVHGNLEELKAWLRNAFGDNYEDEISNLFADESMDGDKWAKNIVGILACANAAKNEILERLTLEFGVNRSICETLLYDNLYSVEQSASNKAFVDWLGVLKSDDNFEVGIKAYALLSKTALIYSYTKMIDYGNIGLENLYQSFPLNSLGIDGDDWDWKKYPADGSMFAGTAPISSSFAKLICCFEVSRCFGSSWIYDRLSPDFLVEKWNLNERQLREIAGLETADVYAPQNWVLEPEEWRLICNYWKVYKKAPIDMDTLQILIADDMVGENEIADYREAVEKLNESIKSKRTSGDWLAFITPVNDVLRKSRRDALVSYICFISQDNECKSQRFFDANDIYSYYLIDVEMEPDMSVSRIRQALNSIQQFVSRVELGLEGSFVLSEEQRKNWEWMRNYRVWEANRKVFLYAENWIETDLRDDKSPFFKELEDEIRQVGNEPEAMHTALENYLEKMYEISGIEILGATKENGGGDGILYTLHIVGRTRGEPHHFFIRKYKAKALYSGEWEPWESLDLEIDAEVVIPVLMNQRLYLTWPTFVISKKEDGAESSGSMDISNQVEIRLNWSYYDGHKWSAVKTTKNAVFDKYGREREIFLEDGEKIDYRYHFQVDSGSSEYIQVNIFRSYYKDVSEVQTSSANFGDQITTEKRKVKVLRDKNQQFIQETGSIQVWVDGRDVAYLAPAVTPRNVNEFPPGKCYLERNCWVERDKHVCGYDGLSFSVGNQILENTPGFFRVLPVNFAFYSGEDLPFFYMDGQHSFLVHKISDEGSTKYQFELISHPLVAEFYKRYRDGGDESLFNRETQALPVSDSYYYSYSYYNYYFSVYLGYYIAGDWEAWDLGQSLFSLNYKPSAKMIARPYPVPMIDFSFGTSNAIYNWELFFHVPMLLAEKMFQEQNYEEALKWYRMVFDPRLDLNDYEITKRWSRSLPKGARFWRFLPFFANRNADDSILETISKPTEYDLLPNVISLQSLVDKWKRDPFNPHLIARYRMAAYQKYVVMKYLDNLIAWADELFTQDTMESINEAIQLYVLAAEVLGPRNIEASDYLVVKEMNVNDFLLEKEGAIANVYVEIEDSLVTTRSEERKTPQGKPNDKNKTLTNIFSSVFYFSVPRNDKLLGYWDTVADRLYKIRNSLNIEGVKRTLALYEPPIDPALLVKARAAGVSIADALSESSAPLPLYRFQVMIQKALDVTHELQSLSSAFMSALEKKDSEALSLMRTRHEQEILTLSRELKDFQVKDLENQLESLKKNKDVVEIRKKFYENIEEISDRESEALALQRDASKQESIACDMNRMAAVKSLMQDLNVGGLGNVGGGPEVSMSVAGGSKFAAVLSHIASSVQIDAGITRNQANQIQTLAGYERRSAEWRLQADLANSEIDSIEKQIVSMEIRIQMAEKEVTNLERQIEQMDEVYEFMTDRFTNQELYSWMVTQLGQLHASFFKLAVKLAKRAEMCYRFELGLTDSDASFIKNDYWDGLRKGLLAGDHLLYDLRTMESAYHEKNKRELEINRAVPLSLIDAEALIKLRTDGNCQFDLPEVLFDLDFPGQTYRRIRGVRLEIHCNASSGQGVNAKLSLLSNRIRKKPLADSYDQTGDYLPSRIGITTIASSQAEAYAGVFNFDFRDERYLPFEGAGVDSTWRLELPSDFRQFDYESISDVILHVSYTARNGSAVGEVKQKIVNSWGIRKSAIRLSAIDSGALDRLRNGEEISICFMKEHFPAIARAEGVLKGLSAYCRFKNGVKEALTINILSSSVDETRDYFEFEAGQSSSSTLWEEKDVNINEGYSIAIKVADGSTPANIEDLIFVHKYALANSVDEEA